jgi:hypothetical protein
MILRALLDGLKNLLEAKEKKEVYNMSLSTYRIVLGILTLVHKKCDAGSWVSEFFQKVGEGVFKASLSLSASTSSTCTYVEKDDEYCRMFLSAKKNEVRQKFAGAVAGAGAGGGSDLMTKQVNMYIEMLQGLEEGLKYPDSERTTLRVWLDELFPLKNKTSYRCAEWMVPFSFYLQKDREDFFNEPEGSRIRHYLFFLESIGDLLRSRANPMNKSDPAVYIPWTTFENMLMRTAGFHGVSIDRAVMEQTKIRLLFTQPKKKMIPSQSGLKDKNPSTKKHSLVPHLPSLRRNNTHITITW